MSGRGGLEIGQRITVFWPEQEEWYKGTVADVDPDYGDQVLVEYDDGDSDWVDTTTAKWRASYKPERFIKERSKNLELHEQKVESLEVGSRVSVWWPKEKEFFTGTLTEVKSDEEITDKREVHLIHYDDGEEHWTNLTYCKFKRVRGKAMRLQVGSRVSAWNEELGRNCPGTITKIIPEKTRPHKVQYDGGNKVWLNLHVHPFLDINPPLNSEEPREKPSATRLMKRKPEFQKQQSVDPILEERRRKKIEIKLEEEETATTKCNEICAICDRPAKRARAASCHHIFCKKCIHGSIQDQEEAGNSRRCPLCGIGISMQLERYDPNHPSFKAVNALEMTTAEIVRTFSSASAASLQSSESQSSPACILRACQSKQRDEREYRGYYWKFDGCNDRILRAGESVKEGIAVEQVDLQTGEVIQVFASGRKAAKETGVARCTIKRVLQRKGKANGGGYFWRYKGEDHEPWPDPVKPSDPVEQLDFETGDVLNTYNSLVDAQRAVGARKSANIKDVCDGRERRRNDNGKMTKRATAHGYFWRWKGSKAMPDHMMGVEKVVQVRNKRDGPIFKEFRTSRDAQAFLDYQVGWTSICKFCREKQSAHGYFWQYKMTRVQLSETERVVGKRLRVFQGSSDDWLEGKITAYISGTGEHEIRYDSGDIQRHKLKGLRYEWKNDQGQKRVEQLDLDTGDVLRVFDSVSNAARELSVTTSNIVAVCSGRSLNSAGFFWRYKGSTNLPKKKKVGRKVQQLCLKTGRVLETHASITAAARAVGITNPGISYCCNGRNNSKSAGGFGWQFAPTSPPNSQA